MRPSKKTEIIEATIVLIGKNGIHNIPTAQIAEEAGVAEITIFRNFETKENLLKEVFFVAIRKMQEYYCEEVDLPEEAKSRFLFLCHRLLCFKNERPHYFSTFEQFYLMPVWGRDKCLKDKPGETSFEAVHEQGLVHFIVDGQRRGELKQYPAAVLMGVILGALFHLDPDTCSDYQDEVFEQLWGFISV